MSWKERCPEAETLLQLSEGILHGRRRRTCLVHVRSCPRCREELAAAEGLCRVLDRFASPQAAPDLAARVLQALCKTQPLAALTCRQARDLISPCLDKEATPEEAERLWAHLFLCGPCLRRYRETERLAVMSRRHEPVRVPAHLLPRVLGAVAQSAGLRRRRPAVRLAPAGLAALGSAAAVLAGLLLLRSPAPGPTGEGGPARSVVEAASPVPEESAVRVAEIPVPGQPKTGQAGLAVAPEVKRSVSTGARVTFAPPAPRVTPPSSAMPVKVAPAPAPTPVPVASPVEPHTVTAPAYVPPTRTPEPMPLPARPPSPALTASPPITVAAAPTRPPAVPPTGVPAERESPSPKPLVVSSEPEAVRQLRWTPSQGSEVVVIRHTGRESDAALAEVNEALNEYGRQLRRTQPRPLVVVR